MRGAVLAGALALAVFANAPAAAQQALPVPPVTGADRVLGSPDAPVTIVEYASFTCPHCADFHTQVLSEIKTRYIDTGQARLVYRDFPTAPAALSETASRVARCAAPEAYFDVVDSLFGGQATMRSGGDPNAWLSAAVRVAGRPAQDVLACVYAPETQAQMTAVVEAAWTAGVRGTPTLIVDGVAVPATLEGLSAAIDARLAAASAAGTP
ncbi:MAG: DsbA family protein [Brevundimonas sp.]